MHLERGAVPPSHLVDVEPIRDALKRHEDATAAAKAADREYVRLERGGRAAAEARDAQELADAIQAGKKPPAPKHVAEYLQQLDAARREASATVIVEARAWQSVIDVFAAHGDQLRNLTDRQIAKARSDYLRALDGLQAAHDTLSQALAWRTFFADSGMAAGVYRPNGAASSIKAPAPHPLDDTQVLVSDAIEQLRWAGTDGPPPPPTNPQQAPDFAGNLPLTPKHKPLAQQGVSSTVGAPGFSTEPV